MFYENLEKLEQADTNLNINKINNYILNLPKWKDELRIEIINCRVYLNSLNNDFTLLQSVWIGLSTIRDGSYRLQDGLREFLKFWEQIDKKTTKIWDITLHGNTLEFMYNHGDAKIKHLFRIKETVYSSKPLLNFKSDDYFFLPKKDLNWLKEAIKNHNVGIKLFKYHLLFRVTNTRYSVDELKISFEQIDINHNTESPTELWVNGDLLSGVLEEFMWSEGMPVIEVGIRHNAPLVLSDNRNVKWFIAPKIYE